MSFYLEICGLDGRWVPQRWSREPSIKDGRLNASDKARLRVRNLTAIDQRHEHLSLDVLADIYGEKT